MKAETTRIPRVERASAIGLYVLAGSWSARELTDGHIPAHMLEELCGSDNDATWLVTSGFWAMADDGWQFCEWAPEQPLREVVLAERAKKAERMRDWRSRNKPSSTATDSTTDTASSWASDATVDLAPIPDPIPDQSKNSRPPKADYTAEFEEWWSVYPRKEAKADALKAYTAARKRIDPQTLLNAVRRYALLKAGEDKDFVKLPAGWIRGERWNDDASTIGTLPARELADDQYCPLHPGYPDTIAFPCEACKRSASLPEGADF